MKKYRSVSWQRNLLGIPPGILEKISQIDGGRFLVATTKQISTADLPNYTHLALPSQDGENASTLPLVEMGKYSTRNQEGWEIKRTDLPKIKKTFYWETPNFGNASRYGWHFHSQEREVYQKEYHEPLFYRTETSVLKKAEASTLYRIGIDQIFDRTASNFESELLFALNLLQENCGSIDVHSASATREDYIKTIALDWEIFPPGTMQEVISALTKGRSYSTSEVALMSDRVTTFEQLRPERYIRGSAKFGSYIGAQYAHDLVVFENLKYGNALYILYQDWQEVSKRSRIDLLKGTDAVFDRVPHTEDWKRTFAAILKREKKKRRI
ncbi:hypothetical protein QA633_23160 [Bradyrhizobium barranii]|uniref:hypothetical protein n=1 Tax=Bradyrhizobium barranii TaxID=2992140 RepID=UPI0024AF7373|nr:hypothetical protein [Bradyrhizobium barranii]WFT91274.1 hypothetical protein QA633_23160 [Bradyrhizobium barranii]